jgi:hypothetical protein
MDCLKKKEKEEKYDENKTQRIKLKVTDSGGGEHVTKERKRIQRQNRRVEIRGDGVSKELWACIILIGKLLLQI